MNIYSPKYIYTLSAHFSERFLVGVNGYAVYSNLSDSHRLWDSSNDLFAVHCHLQSQAFEACGGDGASRGLAPRF